MMCEQTGRRNRLGQMPRRIEDFPDSVLYSNECILYLGDRVYPDIGILGKDYSNLKLTF